MMESTNVQKSRSGEGDSLVDQYEVEFITNVKINYSERNCSYSDILQNKM
jgi:hypothetical protein